MGCPVRERERFDLGGDISQSMPAPLRQSAPHLKAEYMLSRLQSGKVLRVGPFVLYISASPCFCLMGMFNFQLGSVRIDSV